MRGAISLPLSCTGLHSEGWLCARLQNRTISNRILKKFDAYPPRHFLLLTHISPFRQVYGSYTGLVKRVTDALFLGPERARKLRGEAHQASRKLENRSEY